MKSKSFAILIVAILLACGLAAWVFSKGNISQILPVGSPSSPTLEKQDYRFALVDAMSEVWAGRKAQEKGRYEANKNPKEISSIGWASYSVEGLIPRLQKSIEILKPFSKTDPSALDLISQISQIQTLNKETASLLDKMIADSSTENMARIMKRSGQIDAEEEMLWVEMSGKFFMALGAEILDRKASTDKETVLIISGEEKDALLQKLRFVFWKAFDEIENDKAMGNHIPGIAYMIVQLLQGKTVGDIEGIVKETVA
jgi:hypothetical protein